MIAEALRTDCAIRYQAIRRHLDPDGKTLLDVGCQNGYFIRRFMENGGLSAHGVEVDEKFYEDVKATGATVSNKIPNVRKFDVVFYLLLHYHDGTEGLLEQVKAAAPMAFISPSGNDNRRFGKLLKEDLLKLYSKVTLIHSGDYGRDMYKCE